MKPWRFWETWGILAAGVAFFFFHMGGYWSATWLCKWSFLITLSSVILAFWAAHKTSWLYLPLLLYTLVSLNVLSSWPAHPYQNELDAVSLLALQKNAFFGLAEFVSLLLVALSLQKSRLFMGLIVLPVVFWLCGTIGILWQPLSGPNSAPNNGLWFGNPSMGASLLAALLPLVWRRIQALFPRGRVRLGLMLSAWGLTLGAVAKTHASVPWGVLGVATAAFLAASHPRKQLWKPAFWTSLLTFLLVWLGKTLLGAQFWDQNGRFEIWTMAWQWFKAHGKQAWGLGFSSSQTLVPLEQVITGHYHGDYFLWLHNDWLQLLIEGGWVGAACVGLAVGRVLYKSVRYPTLFASLAGFATLALFNYPLRMPIHSLCLAIVWGAVEAHALLVRRVAETTGFAVRSELHPSQHSA